MPRTRTFIGVDIGDAIRKQAVSLQKKLARGGDAVKWADPDGMHITLIFLGDVDDRELIDVCRVVQGVAEGEPPFALAVGGVGAFPNARRPKVVWGGVTEGADELRRLHAALEETMLELGCYRREDRAYTPHLTLGRVKADDGAFALAAELPKLVTWDGGRTTVGEVRVYTSEPTRDGFEYAVIGRGELTG